MALWTSTKMGNPKIDPTTGADGISWKLIGCRYFGQNDDPGSQWLFLFLRFYKCWKIWKHPWFWWFHPSSKAGSQCSTWIWGHEFSGIFMNFQVIHRSSFQVIQMNIKLTRVSPFLSFQVLLIDTVGDILVDNVAVLALAWQGVSPCRCGKIIGITHESWGWMNPWRIHGDVQRFSHPIGPVPVMFLKFTPTSTSVESG